MTKLAEIEGIGESYASKLAAAGVRTTDELLETAGAGKGRKALAERTGISGKLLLKWVNRADLARISGIGSEYADLLEHAGIDSVPELAQRNAENLHSSLEATNSKRKLVRKLPTAAQVADWIAAAKKLPRKVSH